MPDITIATEPMAALATEHGCSLHASGTSSHPVVIVTSEGDATKPRTSISWLLSVGPDGEPRTIVMADMVGPLESQTKALSAMTALLTDPRFKAVSDALALDIVPRRP